MTHAGARPATPGPPFPPRGPTELLYERLAWAGVLTALLCWLPLWGLGPLQLTQLGPLYSFAGGSVAIAALHVIVAWMGRVADPAQMSAPWLLDLLPTGRNLLRLSGANLAMSFLLPVMTFHLLVWSPGFADDRLVWLDRQLGLDHHAWTVWAWETGVRTPLVWAYNSLWPQSALLMIWLLLVRRSAERLWGMTALSVWGGLFALPVFWALPALGPVTQNPDYPPELIHQAYELLRSVGSGETLALTRLDGVVSIPSFHTYFALTMIWGARGERALLFVVVPLNLLVLLSVYVVGFHYLIDVLAGVAWFGLFAGLLELLRRRQVAG